MDAHVTGSLRICMHAYPAAWYHDLPSLAVIESGNWKSEPEYQPLNHLVSIFFKLLYSYSLSRKSSQVAQIVPFFLMVETAYNQMPVPGLSCNLIV
jgi:hypothetical protein